MHCQRQSRRPQLGGEAGSRVLLLTACSPRRSEQPQYLGLQISTVAAERPYRRQPAVTRPPGYSFRVDPEHRGHLGRGEQPIGVG